jgi:hypothetical protein
MLIDYLLGGGVTLVIFVHLLVALPRLEDF